MKVRGRRRRGGRLDLRRLEPEPQHAAGRSDGINLLGSCTSRCEAAGPARHAAQPNGAGDRNAITLYDFPAQRTTTTLIMENPVRTSALRTLGLCQRVCDRVLHDELAAAAASPVAFALRTSRTSASAP